jgi:hypothetical protein
MLDWYGARCKDVADVINENAPGNCQLTSPDIQKDIMQACAEEITQVIMSELICSTRLNSIPGSATDPCVATLYMVVSPRLGVIGTVLGFRNDTLFSCYCVRD